MIMRGGSSLFRNPGTTIRFTIVGWIRLLLLALIALSWAPTTLTSAAEAGGGSANATDSSGEEAEPAVAVLFPWFSLAIGTFAYLVLTRLLPWFPYTALMFVSGAVMGISVVHLGHTNLLTESISDYWLNIDSEVLLLVFLPGLIAKDAMQLDATLFRASFWQCAVFAFPVVLAGTTLTALVCYYVFPYGWSFNLAMTVGSILSATDPVAVAALMAEVGAPPRLQIHISGESLLNDGSAIVFFTIFSEMFLQELGVPGLGRSFTVASGFAVFFRMSLGAAASGLFFGLGTSAVLRVLNRRLNREENVVEVATTFTMAYLTYFVTEQVFHCSGVIGTLTYGVFINHSSFINDPKLMEDFWALVEVLLNTVLFTLGGLVWGEIIANSEPGEQFTGTDWGYLFVLYIFLMLIRFFLLFACYPITASIGLGTSLQETLFSSFAGLRGAVGIALAISLDNVVEAQGIPLYENETNRVFGFVGGIAFLTLTLNATMSGPLLKKLGLADRPALREKVIKILHWRLRQSFIDDMVTLLSEPRFHRVNFAVVRHHLPMIQDVTVAELQAAVRKFRRPKRKFLARSSVPNLTSVTQYIIPEDSAADAADGLAEINELLRGLSEESEREERLEASRLAGPGSGEGQAGATPPSDGNRASPLTVVECRRLFLEILRASYAFQVEQGELVARDELLRALNKSLDFASVDVCNGLPLDDWPHTGLARHQNPLLAGAARHISLRFAGGRIARELDRRQMVYDVDRCMSFLEAHRRSREAFKNEFVVDADNMTEAEATVLRDSASTCKGAVELLESFPERSVDTIVSHRFCTILLNVVVQHVEHLTKTGLLSSKDAEDLLGEMETEILGIDSCALEEHPGELPVPSSEEKGTLENGSTE